MSWPTSPDFDAKINTSHERAVRIEILDAGSTVAVIDPTGGGATVDSTQAIRRRATVPLVDQGRKLIPNLSADLLYPAGNEIRAWRGIDFGDDRPGSPVDIAPAGVELVPVFTGPLYENAIDDQPKGIQMSLDCYDRGRLIQRAKWPTPYLVPAGARWVDVIQAAIIDRMPAAIALDFSGFMDDPATVPKDFAVGASPQGDPWATMIKWARAGLGADLFFDGMGNPILRETPSVNDDPVVAHYRLGQGTGLLGVKKRISLEKIFNVVVAAGQSTGATAPVQAIVRDDDPDSATYTGAIGEITRWYTSPLLTTVAACRRAGQSLLNNNMGGTITLQFSALVNPAREAGDVLKIVDDNIGVSTGCIVDAFPIPFDVNTPSDAAARSRGGD